MKWISRLVNTRCIKFVRRLLWVQRARDGKFSVCLSPLNTPPPPPPSRTAPQASPSITEQRSRGLTGYLITRGITSSPTINERHLKCAYIIFCIKSVPSGATFSPTPQCSEPGSGTSAISSQCQCHVTLHPSQSPSTTEPRLSFSIVLQTYVNTLQNFTLHLVFCCSRISFLLSIMSYKHVARVSGCQPPSTILSSLPLLGTI